MVVIWLQQLVRKQLGLNGFDGTIGTGNNWLEQLGLEWRFWME
jgi:hypothetical protein